MMKKILSLVLAAALLGSLCVPALAAEKADARLTAVVQAVRTTLGLDTEEYDQFYGEPRENELAPTWDLQWSGESGRLSVTAAEDGQILNYYCIKDEPMWIDGGSMTLPETTRADAKEAAQAFLDKVLLDNETARFDDSGWDSLNATRYYFYGDLLLNGLPSPLSFSISVNASDGEVRSFYRDAMAGNYFGDVPNAAPKYDAAAAKAELVKELSLRLEYVVDGSGKAVLRYLDNPIDEFYFDGQTGQLVNLTLLRQELAEGGTGGFNGFDTAEVEEAPMMSAAADSKVQLTQAELEGVDKLAGVLTKEELDAKAKAVPELGLARYTMAECSYSVRRQDKDDDSETKVTARLTYTRTEDNQVWRRYVTVDAKTGELEYVSSSFPWRGEYTAKLDRTEAQKKAEAFLTGYYGEEFGHTAIYEYPSRSSWKVTSVETDPRQWSFNFARKENGYYFPDHSLSVSIDTSDGSVSYFSRQWDWEVEFDSAEGLLTMAEALDIYAGTFDTALGYIAVPAALSLAAPEVRPLLDSMGRRYFYRLALGYGLESNLDYWFQGIDAKTGEIIAPVVTPMEKVSYSDLEGHWVQEAAEILADYNVGWMGGKMEPGKALSQKDLVALLVSLHYGAMDPNTLEGDSLDMLYRDAYSLRILTKEDRDEDKIMTRVEIVKMLLDQGGYGEVARLKGIFKTDFSDADAIPEEEVGYAALAKGLGIVSGDPAGAFAAGRQCTRAEAVEMVYRYLARNRK